MITTEYEIKQCIKILEGLLEEKKKELDKYPYDTDLRKDTWMFYDIIDLLEDELRDE